MAARYPDHPDTPMGETGELQFWGAFDKARGSERELAPEIYKLIEVARDVAWRLGYEHGLADAAQAEAEFQSSLANDPERGGDSFA